MKKVKITVGMRGQTKGNTDRARVGFQATGANPRTGRARELGQ